QRDVDTQGGIATKKKKETARICLMVKHAERYLKEWLDYNLAIGFTDIHVLDNSPEFSLHNWTYQRDKLRIEHFIPNVVNNVTDAGEAQKQQQYGYKHCVEQARADKITWLATFDVDEFLVLHKHDNVLDFMRDTCSARQQHNGSSCGQISINWFTMGSSNRTDYVNVPVTRRFQYGRFQNTVKSIVDPWAVALKEKHFRWSHTFKLAPRRKWFSANGQPVNNRGWKIMVHEEGTLDVAALHHYKYLSKEEWHTKNCVRGDVMGKQQEMKKICNGRAPEPFAGEVFNDDAWQVLRSRVPSYQQYDNVQELG
ncbi:Pfam:DUF23 (Partial), partial [Seminavis robusta]